MKFRIQLKAILIFIVLNNKKFILIYNFISNKLVRFTYLNGHRIYEMHIKDMTKGSVDGIDCIMVSGIVSFPWLIKALRKTKYNGKCSIENGRCRSVSGIAEP